MSHQIVVDLSGEENAEQVAVQPSHGINYPQEDASMNFPESNYTLEQPELGGELPMGQIALQGQRSQDTHTQAPTRIYTH